MSKKINDEFWTSVGMIAVTVLVMAVFVAGIALVGTMSGGFR